TSRTCASSFPRGTDCVEPGGAADRRRPERERRAARETGWKTCEASLRRFSKMKEAVDSAGGAGRTRTADLEFRKLLLYPPELRPRNSSNYCTPASPAPRETARMMQ